MKPWEKVAYDKAQLERERRRQGRITALEVLHDDLVLDIAVRLSPIVREKYDGWIIAHSIYFAWGELARNGGITPREKRDAKLKGLEPQQLMKEALNLVVDCEELTMTITDCGEVILSVWPPAKHTGAPGYVENTTESNILSAATK